MKNIRESPAIKGFWSGETKQIGVNS